MRQILAEGDATALSSCNFREGLEGVSQPFLQRRFIISSIAYIQTLHQKVCPGLRELSLNLTCVTDRLSFLQVALCRQIEKCVQWKAVTVTTSEI